MGSCNDILQGEQWVFYWWFMEIAVQRGSGDKALFEGPVKVPFIDKPPARRIDDDRPFRKACQRFCIQ